MSTHARMRCREMAVRISDVQEIIRDPDVVRPSGSAKLAVSQHHPDIAVVFDERDGCIVVITVVWRSYDLYSRGEGRPRPMRRS